MIKETRAQIDWYQVDDSCCQYIRLIDGEWQMIEYVWLDTTKEDRAKGRHEYAVVINSVRADDITEEDEDSVRKSYGYPDDELDESLVAEGLLEDLCSVDVLPDEFDTEEEATAYILLCIKDHAS